jgi:hypothetical protein
MAKPTRIPTQITLLRICKAHLHAELPIQILASVDHTLTFRRTHVCRFAIGHCPIGSLSTFASLDGVEDRTGQDRLDDTSPPGSFQGYNAWRGLQSECQSGNPSGIFSDGLPDTRLRRAQATASPESGGLIA